MVQSNDLRNGAYSKDSLHHEVVELLQRLSVGVTERRRQLLSLIRLHLL
jgi:hypothetical protein